MGQEEKDYEPGRTCFIESYLGTGVLETILEVSLLNGNLLSVSLVCKRWYSLCKSSKWYSHQENLCLISKVLTYLCPRSENVSDPTHFELELNMPTHPFNMASIADDIIKEIGGMSSQYPELNQVDDMYVCLPGFPYFSPSRSAATTTTNENGSTALNREDDEDSINGGFECRVSVVTPYQYTTLSQTLPDSIRDDIMGKDCEKDFVNNNEKNENFIMQFEYQSPSLLNHLSQAFECSSSNIATASTCESVKKPHLPSRLKGGQVRVSVYSSPLPGWARWYRYRRPYHVSVGLLLVHGKHEHSRKTANTIAKKKKKNDIHQSCSPQKYGVWLRSCTGLITIPKRVTQGMNLTPIPNQEINNSDGTLVNTGGFQVTPSYQDFYLIPQHKVDDSTISRYNFQDLRKRKQTLYECFGLISEDVRRKIHGILDGWFDISGSIRDNNVMNLNAKCVTLYDQSERLQFLEFLDPHLYNQYMKLQKYDKQTTESSSSSSNIQQQRQRLHCYEWFRLDAKLYQRFNDNKKEIMERIRSFPSNS